MPGIRPLRVPAIALLTLLFLGALPALAGDERPVEIPLLNGKSLTGVVQSASAKEVVLAVGPDKVRRVPWTQITPLGVFRVKAALAPPADGKARMKLAELAADIGLYAEARTEYEKAYYLGAINKKQFEGLARAAETDAVRAGVNRAKKQAEAGDLEAALKTAGELRLHFASAPNAREINKLIDELVKRVRELDKEAALAKAELEKATVELKKNKEIIKRMADAVRLLQLGIKGTAECKKAQERGSVSKARKLAEKADGNFQQSRRNLGRLRRILPRGSEMRRDVLTKLNELDEAQFTLLLSMAWFMHDATVWTKAERYTARASYIDPVHPEIMELRDNLMTNRIRYRLSDVSNARPIVR